MQNAIERVAMACPLNGKLCKGGRREDFPKDEMGVPVVCRLWTQVAGMNPQTGEDVNSSDCSLAWMPMLVIEGSNMTRQATASVDKTANIIFSALPGPVQAKIKKELPSLKIQTQPVDPKLLTDQGAA